MSFSRLVAVAAICCAFVSPAAAAERHAINLPAGRLGDSVIALGRQARISIGISDTKLAAEPVPPIRGRMTVEHALKRLLRGKSARAHFISPRNVRIVRVHRVSAPQSQPARRTIVPPPAPEQKEAAEIIVTASRNSVPLKSFPGSVALVSGDDPIIGAGLRGAEAIVELLPSVTSTHLGPGRNKLFVRGISDSSFNGPTQATVGQYVGELRVNYNAPDPDLRLYDVDRIELLSGPQGTLYGAGSLGGILRVVPNPPELDRFAAHLSVGANSIDHGGIGKEAAGTLNSPIVSGKASLRVSGYALSEAGYIADTLRGLEDVNDVRIYGGRATLRFKADEYWTLDAEGIGQSIRGEDAQFAEAGQPPLTRRSMIAQPFGNDYFLGAIVGTREWEEYRFVTSASYVRQELDERFDATRAGNPAAAYDVRTDVTLLAAEARLSRRPDPSSGWLVGAAILSNDLRQNRLVEVLDQTSLRNRVTNKVVEAAVYGEAWLPITQKISAMAGGRISSASLASTGFVINPGSLPEPARASRSDFRFLPSLAVMFQPREELLLYARYQQSFRPGGLAISGSGFERFSPDSLASVEAGARYGAPNRGVFDLTAAVAYTRWDNVQGDTLDLFGEPTTANIGNAELYTGDASVRWRPMPGLEVEAGAILNRSRVWNIPQGLLFTRRPELPGVAPVNARLGVDYAFGGPMDTRMRLSIAGRYTGPSKLGVGDFFRRKQGDWLDTSAIFRAIAGRHALTVAMTNLFDSRANRFAYGSPFTLDQKQFVTPMRPRMLIAKWEVVY